MIEAIINPALVAARTVIVCNTIKFARKETEGATGVVEQETSNDEQ